MLKLIDMLTNETITAIATAITALIAIAVVCYQVYLHLVKLKISIIKCDIPTGLSPYDLCVIANNISQRTINVTSFGFIPPIPARAFWIEEISFPYTLKPNESFNITLQSRDVAKELIKLGYKGKVSLIVYFNDEQNKCYKSKPFEFDIENAEFTKTAKSP